jgi:uncharacterized tellurite resistance protein B-like protein
MAHDLSSTPLASGGHHVRTAADEALHVLLASMACTDGTIHDSEVDFLHKIRPDLGSPEAVRAWALEVARPVDLQGLAQVLTGANDRWRCLRFVARMAWKDGRIAEPEQVLLSRLARALTLPEYAVDRVLREMGPAEQGRFGADRLLKCVLDSHWDAVQLASGALVSDDLVAVSPPTEVVVRVGLEKVEILALCTDGIVARFQEGATFLSWAELVTYSRGDVLGVALRLHTEDGRSFTLVDGRLAGLAIVLDRLLDPQGQRRAAGDAPRISQVRGAGDGE